MINRSLLDKVEQLKPATDNEKTLQMAVSQLLKRAIDQDSKTKKTTPARRDAMEDKD